MKYLARLVTGEYEYIEIEHDNRDELIAEYNSVKAIFKDKEGLNVKEWADFRKKFLMSEGKDQSVEDHEKLNRYQRQVIHEFELTLQSININEE